MARLMQKDIRKQRTGYIKAKVSDAMLREESKEFEKGFPDGVYVAPGSSKEPRIKMKALFEYCMKKGVDPEDLTDEEREQFIGYPEY